MMTDCFPLVTLRKVVTGVAFLRPGLCGSWFGGHSHAPSSCSEFLCRRLIEVTSHSDLDEVKGQCK